MRWFEAVLIAAVAFACSCTPAAKPVSLFPETGEVPGWSRGQTRTFEPANLWQYIDGGADRYVQAGLEKTLTTDYRFRNRFDAVADIYVMSAAGGAQKILESEPSVESKPFHLGDAARLYAASLTFRKHRYFVRLVAYEQTPETGEALVELGRAIENRLGQRN